MAHEQEKVDRLTPDLFLDGPTEYLCIGICALLKADPHWKQIFGDFVDPYERIDYAYRNLPALRVYNQTFTKEHESHYINGDLQLDAILPPSIRRPEHQTFQDRLAAALLQQFRRPGFFAAMRERVPGLNELGKVFSVDKTLGLQLKDDAAPMTQITLNFRVDLKEWDAYLEREGRTKDQPFEKTLEKLRTIAGEIRGVNDSGGTEVTIPYEGPAGQPIEGE